MPRPEALCACVLRAVVHWSARAPSSHTPEDAASMTRDLCDALTHNDTRTRVYDCCLALAHDDVQRRRGVGVFLLLHVVGFPPSRRVRRRLRRCAVDYAADVNTPYASTYATLRRLLDADARASSPHCIAARVPRTHLTRRCNSSSSSATCAVVTPPPSSMSATTAAATTTSRVRLASRAVARATHPRSSHARDDDDDDSAGVRLDVIASTGADNNDDDDGDGDRSRNNNNNNKGNGAHTTSTTSLALLHSYTAAASSLTRGVACTQHVLEQHLRVLLQFRDGYATNAAVAQSTHFFVAHMCADYVGKLLYGAPYTLLRAVSVGYVHVLLECVASEYLCVRNHVYDMLYNLAVHMQLLELPQHAYAVTTTATAATTTRTAAAAIAARTTTTTTAADGDDDDDGSSRRSYGRALQDELVWLVLCVLRRQALTPSTDTTTWTAAAKCAFALLPRRTLRHVDVRALRQMLWCVPALADAHAAAYDVLVVAFVHCLLAHDGNDNDDDDDGDGDGDDAHSRQRPTRTHRADSRSCCGGCCCDAALRWCRIDEVAMATLCGRVAASAHDVVQFALALYRRTPAGGTTTTSVAAATTTTATRADGRVAASRRALFRLLFALAVWRCGATRTHSAASPPSSSSSLSPCVCVACYCACMQLQLPMRVYALLFHAPRRAVQALSAQLLHTATAVLWSRHHVAMTRSRHRHDDDHRDKRRCVCDGATHMTATQWCDASVQLASLVRALVTTLTEDVVVASRLWRRAVVAHTCASNDDDDEYDDGAWQSIRPAPSTATRNDAHARALARLLRVPAVHAATHVAPRLLCTAGGGGGEAADATATDAAVMGPLTPLCAYTLAWRVALRGLLVCGTANVEAAVRRDALSAVARALTLDDASTAVDDDDGDDEMERDRGSDAALARDYGGGSRGASAMDAGQTYAPAARTHARVRRVCVHVLATLAVLSTSSHNDSGSGGDAAWATEAFVVLLEHLLFALHTRHRVDRDTLLRMCNCLLELLSYPSSTTTTTRNAATTTAAHDVASLLLTGQRTLSRFAVVHMLGTRALWCIYRALCACSSEGSDVGGVSSNGNCSSSSTAARPAPSQAVCRLRHVFVALLLYAPPPLPRAVARHAWRSVACVDTYSPVVRLATAALRRLDADDDVYV